MTAGQRAAEATFRWLLLMAVFVGLTLMHTLGHTTHREHVPTPSAVVVSPIAGTVAEHAAHGPAAFSPTTPVMMTGDRNAGMLDPLPVCLALVTAVMLLLLAGSRWCALSLTERRQSVLHLARSSSRSPPLFGVHLTRTAILRM
ncbi:hypothetical protein [Actinomadura sp. 6N118]|uniref:hypothetical protein n=1 Tax=Actinomadura sp. 6N118 TaxID=3375151 RepID=UPI0037A5BB1C